MFLENERFYLIAKVNDVMEPAVEGDDLDSFVSAGRGNMDAAFEGRVAQVIRCRNVCVDGEGNGISIQ